jgi:hypothetical protein
VWAVRSAFAKDGDENASQATSSETLAATLIPTFPCRTG